MTDSEEKKYSLFDSYQTRYLLLGLLLTCSLGIVAWFGYMQVEATSQKHFERIVHRNRASTILNGISDSRNKLLEVLQNIVIEPKEKYTEQVTEVVDHLTSSINDLQKEASVNITDRALIVNELKRDIDELKKLSARLVEIRQDEMKWFPATEELQFKLLPRFNDSLALLQDMSLAFADRLSVGEQEVYKTIQEIRMVWVRMTAELRLFVANRFGVFQADTQKGMAGRYENLSQYSYRLQTKLNEMEQYALEDRLGIYGLETVLELQDYYDNWLADLDSLVSKLTEEGWRKDLVLFRHDILPVLERVQQRVSSLQVELDIQSATDITDLTNTARQLTVTISLITLAVIIIMWLSYFSFNRLVLKPIKDTTHALRQEASGKHVSLNPSISLRETRELAEAFHSMRSQVKERQRKLDYVAHHDDLTNLPNRALFYQHLSKAIEEAYKQEQIVAMFFLDLDRFKKINDTLGHGVGDDLLRKVANRLESSLPECVISRFGGDEFAIIAEGLNDKGHVVYLAEKILQVFHSPFMIKKNTLRVSTSIGIAMGPDDADSVSDLLKAADTAMYVAKNQGRNRYWFFTENMARLVKDKLSLENELHQALIEKQFEVYYQSVESIQGRKLIGFECLLRWNHPERGVLSPAHFIDMLDETGLIKDTTLWLLGQVSSMLKRFDELGRNELKLHINLTARMLQDDEFASKLLKHLVEKRSEPSRLVIELTEDALADYFEDANDTLQALGSLGVQVAIDDFGTGQSSLDHLRSYRFDQVKIDRSYVNDVTFDEGDASLVTAIIKMGHSFRMKVVAEGVETEEQLQFLRENECDLIQGYLISKPVPADEALNYIEVQERNQKPALDVIV